LLLMIPTLFGVAILIFVLLRVVPGDVVEARYMTQGSQFQSQNLMDLERKKLGLDQPIWKQFTSWMGGLLRLDFGLSMWTGSPITEEIKLRFALSLQLAVMATLVATLLAIPLGILAAVKQDTWIDYGVRVFSIAGLAMPSFWLGILMILVMLIVFKWLPPMVYTPFWVNPWDNMAQLIWPALAVGYRYSAVATRSSIHTSCRSRSRKRSLRPVRGGSSCRRRNCSRSSGWTRRAIACSSPTRSDGQYPSSALELGLTNSSVGRGSRRSRNTRSGRCSSKRCSRDSVAASAACVCSLNVRSTE
jgi:hypothetical protein